MRVLLVLAALLLSALITIWARSLIRKPAGTDTRSPTQQDSTSHDDVAGSEPPQTAATARAPQPCASEEQLRRIIREELATILAAHPLAEDAAKTAIAAQSSADNKRQLELVDQQLDHYIRAGVISDSEMASLQMEIGKLDKASQ